MDIYFFYERVDISLIQQLPQIPTVSQNKEQNVEVSNKLIHKTNNTKRNTVDKTITDCHGPSKNTHANKVNTSYQCKQCDKVFKYISDFNVHMSTHKIASTSTIHEIMQEDIDGEISSTHNSVFSQQYEENIPPDPSEEAFLRQFDEEKTVPMNVRDEIDNQASPHQQLPVNVQDADVQPRRSTRLAAIRQQQPRQIGKRTLRQLNNIARSCDVQYFNENDIISKVNPHYAGLLSDVCCKYCKAFRYKDESDAICCKRGGVKVASTKEPPEPISNLINSQDKNLVQINDSFSFTSLGCNQNLLPGYNPIFKIQGKIYHRIGSLLPQEGAVPKYAQVYIFDTENELQIRLNNQDSNLDKEILKKYTESFT